MTTVALIADGMPSGGTERQIVELLKGMSQIRPDVHMLFGALSKGGKRESEANHWAHGVLPIKQSHPLNLTLAWSLIKFIKRYSIDIVHTFGTIADLSGIISGKFCGIKVVNGSIRSARKRLTRRDKISKWAMSYADMVVANSYAGLKAFDMDGQSNVRVIYNGVGIDQLSAVDPVNYQRPYVCMVGNFTPKKDHQALIRAFPKILETYPQLDLVLIGRGKEEGEVRRLTADLGLEDNVVFVTDCDDPGGWIRGAQICVLLSPDGEGLSNVILEYSALSRPIVATDRGGNREIIEDGSSGILIGSHDPDEISSTISRLLIDESKMETMALRAHEIVREKFGWERMINEYAMLYHKLQSTGKIVE